MVIAKNVGLRKREAGREAGRQKGRIADIKVIREFVRQS